MTIVTIQPEGAGGVPNDVDRIDFTGNGVTVTINSNTKQADVAIPGAAADVVAWVNFNGQGTPAIRAQKNVASITDNGTGAYTINFTTPLADANYAYTVNHCSNYGVAGPGATQINSSSTGVESAPTTAGFSILCVNGAGAAYDPKYINVIVTR